MSEEGFRSITSAESQEIPTVSRAKKTDPPEVESAEVPESPNLDKVESFKPSIAQASTGG